MLNMVKQYGYLKGRPSLDYFGTAGIDNFPPCPVGVA